MKDISWDAYARATPHTEDFYNSEPVQRRRVDVVARRCVGTVLDVGGGDGFIAGLIKDAGHRVSLRDISPLRVQNAQESGIPAKVADAADLPDSAESFDTVLLGEILEHLPNPGPALTEACRVARRRVVITLPLNGWADPTHRWRIRLDVLTDPIQHAEDPTKGQQIVLTMEKGTCWPPDYYTTDPEWAALFEDR